MTDKPVSCMNGEPCQFGSELESLKGEVKQLAELVSTDTLTGLYNYRHFTTVISQEIERSQRTGQPTTLIMLDADHFKKVNDNWGHEIGNQALKLIAACLQKNIRKLDIPCRYGGEEFAIILPSTDIATSVQVAERIRVTLANTPLTISHPNGEINNIQLTISLGLSSYKGNKDDNWNELVARADNELYRAKEQGRNRICYTPSETTHQQVSEDEKSALFNMFK